MRITLIFNACLQRNYRLIIHNQTALFYDWHRLRFKFPPSDIYTLSVVHDNIPLSERHLLSIWPYSPQYYLKTVFVNMFRWNIYSEPLSDCDEHIFNTSLFYQSWKARSGKRNYMWRKNAFNKTCSISYLRTWYISSKYWWNNLNLSCYLLCCQFLLLREFFAAFDLQSSVTSSLITTASTELNLVTWTIALITEIACTFPVNIPIIRIVQSYEKSFCLHFIFFFNFRNFPLLLRPHQKHCLLK